MKVLVTGATGQQGGAVARALLERHHQVRAFTRDPGKPEAKQLRSRGAEVVQGDFEDPETISRAAAGVDAGFVMGTPYEKGPDAETKQCIATIDALTDAGVKHIVYASVADADNDTGIPHFESKARVERHLTGVDVPYTIVAPVFFRENLHAPWMREGLQQGRLVLAMPSDRPLQNIEVREIGAFVAEVLEDRKRFENQRIDIASDETTPAEMARAISHAAGAQVEHVAIRPEDTGDDDMASMFRWFTDTGYSANIAVLRREHSDLAWRGFREWADEQDWSFVQEAPQQAH